MNRAEAGALGGRRTVERHGKDHMRKIAALGGRALVEKHGLDHMSEIAAAGGRAFWEKYTLRPLGTSDFAIVDRATGEATGATLNGYHLPPRKDTEP